MMGHRGGEMQMRDHRMRMGDGRDHRRPMRWEDHHRHVDHWDHGGHRGYRRGGVWYGFGGPAVSVVSYGHVWGGNPYCWYGSGWHHSGWYRCGYAWRSGYGWGGGSGWNGWYGVGAPAVSLSVGTAGYHTWGGSRYCWYDTGWNGGGWYRCGYSWRSGLGWGGGWGWRGWVVSGRHAQYWRDHHGRDHHGRDHHGRDHNGRGHNGRDHNGHGHNDHHMNNGDHGHYWKQVHGHGPNRSNMGHSGRQGGGHGNGHAMWKRHHG